MPDKVIPMCRYALQATRSVTDVLQAHSRFLKFVGSEVAGQTTYTFYKPTMGRTYVSYRPFNEFVTPTTFVQPIISILNGSPLNPSQTYTATALRPLRDWQFSPMAEVATRSPIGPGEVAEKSATSRGPRCDQISRSQVFENAQKPGCDWFGRRQVPAKLPTSPRSVADRSPTNFVRIGAWLSLKLVGDRLATGWRSVSDLSVTSPRPHCN